jgi:protein-disulfide isomerase
MKKHKSGVAVVISLIGLATLGQTAACADRPKSKATQKTPAASAPTPQAAAPQQLESKAARRSPFETTVYSVPVSDKDPQKGSPDALVTVVLFGDFQCEWSKQGLGTVDGLLGKYGDDVRLVWKNRPMGFYENAVPAASLAMEAFAEGGSPKFWEAANLLFTNQKALSRADLEKYGAELKLDRKKVKAALEKESHKAKIEADKALSRRITDQPTTPMFTVNGRYLRGAQKPKFYEALIEEELAKARARVAEGTPKNAVYNQIVLAGATTPAALVPDPAVAVSN